jgi:hypothetical protein
VLFDVAPRSNKVDQYAVTNAPLQILTCQTTNYIDGVLSYGPASFIYTNTSPDGALLQLTQSGINQYDVLFFTNTLTASNEAGVFFEYLTNGLVNSGTGTFNIDSPPQAFNISPANQTVTNNQNATFSATVNGTQPLFYQWQLNGVDLTDSTIVTGSTSNTLNLTFISSEFTNYQAMLTLVASNIFGSASSSAGVAFGLAPVITNWSYGNTITVTNGTNVSLAVTASGTPNLYYQWQLGNSNLMNGSLFGSTISGATTANLSITPANTNFIGNYTVLVTNNFGAVTSSIVELQVMQ